MKRETQLPPIAYSGLSNRLLLALYHSPEFPTRLRILTNLERLLGSKRLQATTCYGFRMAVDRVDLLQRSVLNDGIWEDECSEAIRKELRPEDIFFDIGCNVGYHTLLALAAGVRKVIAFDPDPLTCEIFKLNLRLNGWNESHYSIYQCALSNQEGTSNFFRSSLDNTGRSGLFPRDVVSSFPTKTFTIDSLLERSEVPRPTVVKLDVEGWEYQVLSGGRKLFKQEPPRCIFFENNPECPSEERLRIWSFFEEFGYQITRVEDNSNDFHNNYLAKLRPS